MSIVGEIFLALSLMATVAGVGQDKIDEDEVVRVETALVTVPVIMSDRDGKYVRALQNDCAISPIPAPPVRLMSFHAKAQGR